MDMRFQTLEERELKLVQELFRNITEALVARNIVRADFKRFLKSDGISLDRSTESKLVLGKAGPSYRDQVLRYDFAQDELRGILDRLGLTLEQSAKCNATLELLAEAAKEREARIRESKSRRNAKPPKQDFGAIEKQFGHFRGAFFGYRLSRNVRRVVRYFLEVQPIGDHDVIFENRFHNQYANLPQGWTVRGSGQIVGNTLHLYGEAEEHGTAANKASLGWRAFALTRLWDTDLLIGPMLTQPDKEAASIAARTVLVPIDDHTLPQQFSRWREDQGIKELLIRTFLGQRTDDEEGREKSPRSQAARRTASMALTEDRLEAELDFPPAYKKNWGGTQVAMLHGLIRNGTFTVLQGSINDDDATLETLAKVAEVEARFFEHANSAPNGAIDLAKEYAHALSEYLQKMKPKKRKQKK